MSYPPAPASFVQGFSYNVLVGIELVEGHGLCAQEAADYIALWRYIGWRSPPHFLAPCPPRARGWLFTGEDRTYHGPVPWHGLAAPEPVFSFFSLAG